MAPIGWHVLAGLIVNAERSMTSAVVCRSSIAVSCLKKLSAISFQLSAFSYQLSAIGYEPLI
jgi:hypothetical protein